MKNLIELNKNVSHYSLNQFKLAHYKHFKSSKFEIKTSKQFASYTILFPGNSEKWKDEKQEQLLLTSVTLSVKKGEVSVGILNSTQDNFIDERRAFTPEKTTYQLISAENCGPLVIKNFNSLSNSIFQIHDINTTIIDPKQLTQRFEPIDEKTTFASQPNWYKYFGDSTKSLSEKLRLNEFKKLKEPIIFDWIYGIKFQIYPKNSICRALYVSQTYEPCCLNIARLLVEENSIVVDVGAHHGLYTLLLSKLVGEKGQVLSFEPGAQEFARLQENINLNKLKNIAIEKCALGNKNEMMELFTSDDYHSGHNTLNKKADFSIANSRKSEVIPVVTLDCYLKSAHFNKIDFIKIDVEGYEYPVLAGAEDTISESRPIILFEFSYPQTQNEIESVNFLLNKRYLLFIENHEQARFIKYRNQKTVKTVNMLAIPKEKTNFLKKFHVSQKLNRSWRQILTGFLKLI